MTPGQFDAIGVGEIRRTFYSWTRQEGYSDPVKYSVHVRDGDDAMDSAYFELTAVEVDEDELRLTWVGHNKVEKYKAKGLPEAIMAALQNRTGRRVFSSKKWDSQDSTNRRSDDSDGMWQRLEKQGFATYYSERDQWEFLSEPYRVFVSGVR